MTKQPFNSNINVLNRKLSAVHSRELVLQFFAGLMKAVAASCSLLLLICGIEYIAQGSVQFRTVLAGLWAFLSLAALIVWTGPTVARLLHILPRQNEDQLASRVGNVYTDIRDLLLNAMQLKRMYSTEKNGVSIQLIDAAFEQIARISESKDFSAIINRQEIKRSGVLFFVTAFASALIFILIPGMNQAFGRIIHYNQSFIPPAPFSLSLQPVNETRLRGEKTAIIITATGSAPASVQLFLREEKQEKYDQYTLRPDTAGRYIFPVAALKQSLEFYAQAEWLTDQVRTPDGHITVLDRPVLRSLSGTLAPPAYTRQPARSINEQSADILSIRGSVAEFTITASKELESAAIRLIRQKGNSDENPAPDTLMIPMAVHSRQANGRFTVQGNGFYSLLIKDREGNTNADPVQYSITSMPDNSPSISLIEPQNDATVGENAKLSTQLSIADDYGFSALKLWYRLAESRYAPEARKFSSIDIPFSNNQISAEISYLWDLNKIGISPSDRYEFYFEVTDNDRISGPKSARTGILSVRLPSLDEVLAGADSLQDKIAADLDKMQRQSQEVAKEIEELQREMMRQQQKMDWQDAKKAENMLRKQADMQQKMEQLSQKLENMTQQLQQNNAITPETLEKYKELQKLMREVNSPELRKAMEEMQKAMQQLSPEQIQQAMKNMKFNEEQFRKGIERTMNILKRIQAEQKTDALTKRAEQLAEKQEELSKKTENANSRDQEARREMTDQQKALQKDLKDLAAEMKDLEKLMKELQQQMPMNEMEKAKQELNEQETSDNMQESQESMQQGDMEKSARNQKKASQNLRKFAQQMKKMKQEMKKNMNKEAMRQMQKSLQDALSLSKQQEAQRQKSQSLDYNSTQLPQSAQEQQKLQEQLANMAAQMMQLAQKTTQVTPQMAKELGNAMQKMQQANEQLAQRNPSQASQSQGMAMSALNKASIQMQEALNKMKGEGDGACENPGGQGEGKSGQGGFMQKLQQLAGMQQQINQGMPQPGADGQLSMEQQQQIARLAGQQGKAQQAMEELARQQNDPSGKRKGLGDLQKLAEEMKEIVADMQDGSITPETRRRQEKILSRLLDASRSMNERDYETSREARSGQDISRKSPPPLDYSNQDGRSRAMQEVLRSLGQGYTKDYEALIRQYFDRLQQFSSGARR
jgi:hypothetical protein